MSAPNTCVEPHDTCAGAVLVAATSTSTDASVSTPFPMCSHYKRGCRLVFPCCDTTFTCRLCHDEHFASGQDPHVCDRFAVQYVVCSYCHPTDSPHAARQPVTEKCRDCGQKFGAYTCLKCRLFDAEDKGQFHCDECGICRVGGKENFFHCEKCGCCLAVQLKEHHKCVYDSAKRPCVVCLVDMFESREPLSVPRCGHVLHQRCLEGMLKWGHNKCPMCQHRL